MAARVRNGSGSGTASLDVQDRSVKDFDHRKDLETEDPGVEDNGAAEPGGTPARRDKPKAGPEQPGSFGK
jgi:hypothetical protein